MNLSIKVRSNMISGILPGAKSGKNLTIFLPAYNPVYLWTSSFILSWLLSVCVSVCAVARPVPASRYTHRTTCRNSTQHCCSSAVSASYWHSSFLRRERVSGIKYCLTHLPLDNMDAISQTIFSDAFSWMKSFVFWLKSCWSLFLRVQMTINQHWLR